MFTFRSLMILTQRLKFGVKSHVLREKIPKENSLLIALQSLLMALTMLLT